MMTYCHAKAMQQRIEGELSVRVYSCYGVRAEAQWMRLPTVTLAFC